MGRSGGGRWNVVSGELLLLLRWLRLAESHFKPIGGEGEKGLGETNE